MSVPLEKGFTKIGASAVKASSSKTFGEQHISLLNEKGREKDGKYLQQSLYLVSVRGVKKARSSLAERWFENRAERADLLSV